MNDSLEIHLWTGIEESENVEIAKTPHTHYVLGLQRRHLYRVYTSQRKKGHMVTADSYIETLQSIEGCQIEMSRWHVRTGLL